ncbi:MAG TPA: phosphatase PAP2 family protein [Gemmatimonadaceae bacterium]|nr:phosphatase PAP2 family protein [Gemmatimonadaceae bacterium]
MHRRLWLAGMLALALSFFIDQWVSAHVVYARVYDSDGGRLLRVIGFWPTWVVAALVLWLHEGRTPLARHRALLLAGSPAVSGIAGELLKLLARRERPSAGFYVFRPFSHRTFSTSSLSMPSSHTIVAFGAAVILGHLYPRTRWVWFALAAGCGITRILAHAHFLSDVVAAVLVAFATSTMLWRRWGATSS